MRMSRKNLKNKKGQLTLFIIIGVIIIVGVILFFIFFQPNKIDKIDDIEISSYISNCMEDPIIEAVDIMLPQGGYLAPENYKLFEDKKIGYLCYNNNYYLPCITQEPMYIKFLEEEIINYSQNTFDNCISSLKKEAGKLGYEVNFEEEDFKIDLEPNIVKLIINGDFNFEKNEENIHFEGFESSLRSSIYDLALVAIEIVNQESKYCNFEYIGYSVLYKEFKIDKFLTGDSVKIYTILHKKTGKELKIAIRSCARTAAF